MGLVAQAAKRDRTLSAGLIGKKGTVPFPRLLRVALVAWLAACAVVCRAQEPASPPASPQPPAPTQPAAPPQAPPPETTSPPAVPGPPTAPETPAPSTTAQPETAAAPGAAAKPETPAETKLGEDEYKLEADEFIEHPDSSASGRGHVRIHYRDLVLTADVGRVDKNHEWVELEGNVLITSPTQRTTAAKLRFNLETGEWQLTTGRTELDPGFFAEGKVKEPVYLDGAGLVSTPRANLVDSSKTEITTCDLAHPHYDITADDISIRPGRDITFDHPSVYLFGHRLFRYPGKIRLSLRDTHSKIIPEVGQNDVEGFYAKFAYPYDGGKHANGLIRLSLTTKRGVGVGVDHYFDTGQQSGEFSVFYEPFMSSYSALVQHMIQVNRTLSSSLNASVQTNSGYGLGASTSFASDWTVRADSANAHTTIGFQESLTNGSGYSSQSFTSNLLHQQTGPVGLAWTIRSVLQASDYGASSPENEQLQLYVDLSRKQPAFDWDLNYQQWLDLNPTAGTGGSFFYALDQLPALSLSSDTKRLGLPLGIPITTRLEIGRFHEQPEDLTLTRYAVSAELYGQNIHLAKGHDVLSGLAFRQAFYSDGSAQYDVRASADFQSHWGGPWYSQLSWGYELPQGFAPLRTDFAARQNNVSVDLSRYIANRSRLELSSGYDLETQTWQDVLLRGELTPSTHHRFELETAFDPNYHEWRPVQFRWQYAQLSRLNLTFLTAYDIRLSSLSQVALDSDWVINRKWRLETLTGYNGAVGDFDYLEARITRDLHCWLGSLSYSFSNREVRLNFALKAFPFEDWEYGIGNRGQLLTPTFGQYY